MKLLIIGPTSLENDMLIKAARKRKHIVKRVSIGELIFVLKKNVFKITHNGRDIGGYDVCLFRGIHPSFDQARTIAKYFSRLGKVVVDRELHNKVYAFDKMFMYAALQYHGLPLLDSFYYQQYSEYEKSKQKFTFPLLVKDLHGMRSRNIFVVHSKKELDAMLKKIKIKDFFLQQFLDVEYVYRVLVVGNNVVAAIRRYTLNVINNRHLTAKEKEAPPVTLPAAIKKLALKAAKETNTDIAGIDIIFDNKNKPYILEVNRTPGFKSTMRQSGVPVPEKIIMYLERLKNNTSVCGDKR